MKLPYYYGIIPLLSLFVRVFSTEDHWISMLTNKDLETKVQGSKDVWIVGATMLEDQVQTEEYMMLLGNVYAKVKQYNIKVGYIDCLMKAHTKTCANIHQGMVGQKWSLVVFTDIPSLNPYTNKMYRKAELFQGKPADVRQVERFLIKQFNPINFKMVEKARIDDIDADLRVISKPTLAVIAATTKSSSFKNMIYKVVAQNFSSVIDVIAYKAKETIVSTMISSDAMKADAITIHMIQPSSSSSSSVITYDGDVASRADISTWIESIIVDTSSSSSSSSSTSSMEENEPTIITSSLIFSSSNLTESSMPLDEEWIIAVTKSSSSSSGWKKVEAACGGVVKAAILYCDDHHHDDKMKSEFINKLCIHEGENDYVVVVPYGSSARKKFISHASSPSSKWTTYAMTDTSAMVSNIGSSLPESSIEAISEQLFQEVIQRAVTQQRLPAFYLPDKTADSIIPASVIHMALSLDKYIQTVMLSKPSRSFMKQFGGLAGPALLVMVPHQSEGSEIKLQPVVYDPKFHGSLSYVRLNKFLKEVYLSSILAQTESGSELLKESISSQPQAKLDIHEVTDNHTWSTACAEVYRGICVIHITSKDSGYSDSILHAIIKDDVTSSSIAKTVTLMHVDGGCKSHFIEQFGVGSDLLPTLVLYAPFKQRYAVFKGGLTEASAVEFVTSVLSGKISTSPISTRPSIDDGCTVNDAIISDETVVEEDASDFLAEILAEEKAKAEAVKVAAAEAAKKLAEEKLSGGNKKKATDKKKKKKKAKKVEDEEL